MPIVVSAESPTAPDVIELLERHLAFSREVTPAGGVFALDPEALSHVSITFLCARSDGRLVGVIALQELDAHHGEVKSMHTAEGARRQGVGRVLIERLLDVARSRGYERVSLETGNFDAFAPARALYESVGFEPCAPYGEYVGSPTSACMTLDLLPPGP